MPHGFPVRDQVLGLFSRVASSRVHRHEVRSEGHRVERVDQLAGLHAEDFGPGELAVILDDCPVSGDSCVLLEVVWLHQVLVVVHLEVAVRFGVRLEQRDEGLFEDLFGEGVVFVGLVLFEAADPDLHEVREDLRGVSEQLRVGQEVGHVLEELGGVVRFEHVHDADVGFGSGLGQARLRCPRRTL